MRCRRVVTVWLLFRTDMAFSCRGYRLQYLLRSFSVYDIHICASSTYILKQDYLVSVGVLAVPFTSKHRSAHDGPWFIDASIVIMSP